MQFPPTPQRPEALNPLNLGLWLIVSRPVWVLRTKLVILLATEPSLQSPGKILISQFREKINSIVATKCKLVGRRVLHMARGLFI